MSRHLGPRMAPWGCGPPGSRGVHVQRLQLRIGTPTGFGTLRWWRLPSLFFSKNETKNSLCQPKTLPAWSLCQAKTSVPAEEVAFMAAAGVSSRVHMLYVTNGDAVSDDRARPPVCGCVRPPVAWPGPCYGEQEPAQRPAMELDSSRCFRCTTCPCQSANVGMAPACMTLSQC